jgi:hypothetical protein
MNINYNKSNKSIEIKDALKPSLSTCLMVLNLVNAILNLSDKSKLWFHENNMLILGTISIVILYNSILKKKEWIKYQSTK